MIELSFGIPFNVYYYLDLNLKEPAESKFPFLLGSDEHSGLSGSPVVMKDLLGLLLWLLTSPALLIAIVVYILAPEEESSLGVNSCI